MKLPTAWRVNPVAMAFIVSALTLAASLLILGGKLTTTVSDVYSCPASDFRCYAGYYASLTYARGPAAAFVDIKQSYKTDSFVKSQCHQLTHIIGRTAYKKYGGLSGAFSHGDSFCWSGFHHGAVEQAIGAIGKDKIKAEANDVCASLAATKRYSFDHFNCVHGLGHGFMAIDGYELPSALKSCDLIHDDWEKSSCYGGVFMENVMVAARENGFSKYLKKDDLMFPCDFVEQPYKQQCYMMQTSYILQQNGYNFSDTFQRCAAADTAFVATCYQSLGRDASGSTISDADRTVANCRQSTDHEAVYNCMIGAAKDFVSYFHSDSQAKQLCQDFGSDIEARCLSEVANYYKVF